MALDSEWGRVVATLTQPDPPPGVGDSAWGRLVATLTDDPGTGVNADSVWGVLGPVVVGICVTPMATVNPREPERPYSHTATIAGPQTPTAWAWRQVSGPPVTLSGANTATVTFEPPSASVDGLPVDSVVVLGVRVTATGIQSPEENLQVNGLNALEWQFDASTGTWRGHSPDVGM